MIKIDDPLKDALIAISKSGAMMACVVDADEKLLGIITDSDVRKALLQGGSIEDPAASWMNKTPFTLPQTAPSEEIVAISAREGIREIPILSSKGKLVDVFVKVFYETPQLEIEDYDSSLTNNQVLPNAMFILAGGKGMRLRSVVSDRPKPLALVGGKPILQTIIQEASKFGIKKFYISVNYLAEKIEEHLQSALYSDFDIRIIKETEFLGTAGSLGLIPDGITDNIIICNGDILTKIPFDTLLKFHNKQSADMTCVVRPYKVNLPFGVVNINDGTIDSISEKPTYSYLVNTGIYVLSPKVVSMINKNTRLDMTDLMKILIENKMKLSPFLLYEYWMDIGHPEDFHKASREFNQHFEEQ